MRSALVRSHRAALGGMIMLAAAAALGLVRPATAGAAVTVDTGFGVNGVAQAPVGANGGGNAVAVQADGRIVVAGQTQAAAPSGFAIARFRPGGSLDPKFGNQGKVTVDVGSHAVAAGVLDLGDGRILVTGAAVVGPTVEFAAVRLKWNGGLDRSFGGDGIVTVPVGSWGLAMAAVRAGGRGKVILGGHARVREAPGATDSVERWGFAAVRLNQDGSVDRSYGVNGTGVIDQPSADYGIAIQPDGKLVFGGITLYEGRRVVAAGRLTASGLPDPSFGSGGLATVPTAESAAATGVAVDPNGSIILAGNLFQTPHVAIAARLQPNGALDPAFGAGGIVKTFAGGAGNGVVRQADGRILIPCANGFRALRLNANGSVDTSFGSGGVMVVPTEGTAASNGATIQPDGKIVLGGAVVRNGVGSLAAARLLGG